MDLAHPPLAETEPDPGNAGQLRPFVPADVPRLAEIYRESALQLGRRAYGSAQVRAWARHAEDEEAFGNLLARGVTLCVTVGETPVAFGQLYPDDHVAYLYCHPDHAGQGHAGAILAVLEARARSRGVERLRVEASAVARPFFARQGYTLVAKEQPVRHGVVFVRFRMDKRLEEERRPSPRDGVATEHVLRR